YRETPWRELADRAVAVPLALRTRGPRPRDTTAIPGHPPPEWTIAEPAAQAAGGTSARVKPTTSPAAPAYLPLHTAATPPPARRRPPPRPPRRRCRQHARPLSAAGPG